MEKPEVIAITEEVATLTQKMTLTVPWSIVTNYLEAEYDKVRHSANISGFRKGKAPRSILEKMFGEQIKREALNELVGDITRQKLEKEENTLIAIRHVEPGEMKTNEDFVFSIIAEFEPKLDPIGYLGMNLERVVRPVTQGDLDERVKNLRELYATLEDAGEENPLAMGDFASIAFRGSCNGVEHESMKADDYLLEIGSGNFLKGFEEGLVGMKVNETRELHLQFPDNYHIDEMRSQDAIFIVTLKGIKKKIVPELNEEFLQHHVGGALDTVEKLMEEMKKVLADEKNKETEARLRDSIIEQLLEINPFAAPPSYVEWQINSMLADLRKEFIARGMDQERATQMIMSQGENYRKTAEKIVKTMLLFKNIAYKENISVSEEEVDERIKNIAGISQSDFNKFKKRLEKDGNLNKINFSIFDEKLFSLIKDKATITEREESEQEAS